MDERFERSGLLPVMSEKSLVEARNGRYTFRVEGGLNKKEIKRRVERDFEVKVSRVKVAVVKGKQKTLRNRRRVKRPDWKKAVISLLGGRIELFEKS